MASTPASALASALGIKWNVQCIIHSSGGLSTLNHPKAQASCHHPAVLFSSPALERTYQTQNISGILLKQILKTWKISSNNSNPRLPHRHYLHRHHSRDWRLIRNAGCTRFLVIVTQLRMLTQWERWWEGKGSRGRICLVISSHGSHNYDILHRPFL